MAKLLLKTQLAIDDCEQHLKDSNSSGTAIEAYLTQHLLVVMCADVQQEIYNIVDEKAKALSTDWQSFAYSAGRRLLRSVQKDSLAAFVGHFGADIKDALNLKVDDKDVTIYNNAVSARHDVAHKHGTSITFDELKQACIAARKILSEIQTVLT